MTTKHMELSDRADEFEIVQQAIDAMLTEPIPDGPPRELVDELLRRRQKLLSDHTVAARQQRGRLFVVAGLTTTVLIVLACLIMLEKLGGTSSEVLAQAIAEIERARTVRWNWVAYMHVADGNGNKWREEDRAVGFYKAPGFERWVYYDRDDGTISTIEIHDKVRGTRLKMSPKRKEAVLERTRPMSQHEKRLGRPRNYLLLVPDGLTGSHVQRLGERENVDGYRVMGFRLHAGTTSSEDVWIDSHSRRVVRTYEPSVDVYDPENDPVAVNDGGSESYSRELMGSVRKDIIYNAPMDDEMFSTTPPADYKVMHKTSDGKYRN